MSGIPFDFLGWMLLPCALLGWRWRWGWVLVVLVVPLLGDFVLAMLRGLFGGLSVTTVALLLALALKKGKGWPVFAGQEARWLPPLIVVAALLFYPAALGWGALDPYEWGHDEALVLPLMVGALALVAWLAGWRVSALTLTLALALWHLHMLESTNLWDYLLDPLLTFAVLGVLAARGLRRIWPFHTRKKPEPSV
jgi:hypothetical protein